MVAWAALRARLQTAVDSQFAERVLITPYKKGGQLAEPVSDGSRAPFEMKAAVIERSGAMSGALRAAGTLAFLSRRLEADKLLSVRNENLGTARTPDQVDLLTSGGRFEISFVEPPVYDRTMIHLTIKK